MAVKGKGPGKESRDAVHTSAGRPAAGLPRSLTSFSLEGQLQQTACVGSCPPLWTPSERELCSQGPCPGLSSFSLKGKLSYSSGGHPIPHSASCPDSPTPISGFLLCPPDGPGVQVECSHPPPDLSFCCHQSPSGEWPTSLPRLGSQGLRSSLGTKQLRQGNSGAWATVGLGASPARPLRWVRKRSRRARVGLKRLWVF